MNLVENERKLNEGSAIATVTMEAEYRVVFSFKPLDSSYGNVIDFDNGSGGGDGGPFILWSYVSNINHIGFWPASTEAGHLITSSVAYPLNQWINIVEMYKRVANQYVHTIMVNGKPEYHNVNKKQNVRRNVTVYASAPWYDGANGYLRNLIVYNYKKNGYT